MRFDDDEDQGVNRPRVPDPLRHPPGVKGAARRYADGLQPSLTPTGHRSFWHLSGGRGQTGGYPSRIWTVCDGILIQRGSLGCEPRRINGDRPT